MDYPISLICFICNRQLDPINYDELRDNETHITPSGGTIFTTHGNYGSTIFDTMDSQEYLNITICDICIVARKENVLHKNHESLTTFDGSQNGIDWVVKNSQEIQLSSVLPQRILTDDIIVKLIKIIDESSAILSFNNVERTVVVDEIIDDICKVNFISSFDNIDKVSLIRL